MKYKFELGETIRVNELALTRYGEKHFGEIGFITDRHPYPKGFEPPYDVEFGYGEIDAYYDYELERIH